MSSPSRRYGKSLAAYLTAAIVTGFACVWFARGFDWALRHRLDFNSIGSWSWVTTPLIFCATVACIRKFAPYAAGTGIPQTLFAAEHYTNQNEPALAPLFSTRTLFFKTLTLYVAVMAGASTGREGPTVHIAAGVFFGVLWLFRYFLHIEFDGRSALIAGGAAGLAAAFNTPLAGVTFAIEELSEQYFENVKEVALMAIIVAAITAQVLTGDYGYFGRLREPVLLPLGDVLLISIVIGLCGLCFSLLLRHGSEQFRKWFQQRAMYLPLIMGFALTALAALSGMTMALGPGNDVAQRLLEGQTMNSIWSLGPTKILATLVTYWSGLSGGIFAPCLSMGAGLGAEIAALFHWPSPTCALIGMAAFLSGTIQAPMTAFVIIFEMTGHHDMLLPLMLGSLIPFIAARFFEIPSLYKRLAQDYEPILKEADHQSP
jgi:H+/Cl- antiporter ClcA